MDKTDLNSIYNKEYIIRSPTQLPCVFTITFEIKAESQGFTGAALKKGLHSHQHLSTSPFSDQHITKYLTSSCM